MKKILLLGIILAMALTLIIPTVAMAAPSKDFTASGKFISIDEGNVSIIGFDDVYQVPVFNVQDRHIQGEFSRSVKGESNRVNGPFIITYDAVVNGYQIGTFSGVLDAKSATFAVEGISYGINLTELYTTGRYRVDLGGTWKGTQGIKGEGTFTACFYFIPDGLHIGALTDSSFTMAGDFGK